MKKHLFIYLLNLLFMSACAQKSNLNQNKEAVNWIPFLTKNNNYIYVDKDMNKKLDFSFSKASPFSSTGFALVENPERKNAVIDSKGNIIIDYTDETLELSVINNLTLVQKNIEYDKNMPFWKWDWNILGSITKTKTYKKIEIKVLETNQILISKDIPYDEEYYNLNNYQLDENHFVMNDILYEIKNNHLKKLKNDVAFTLDNGKYIPNSENKFNIYTIKKDKPIVSNLVGTNKIEVKVNNQLIELDSINQDRYTPQIPKLLQDPTTKDLYVYPQYEKVFPKQIKNITAEQFAFLKKVSLIYSVNNSPYFILGQFNYNHDVWAYDWLYIDLHGNILSEINVNDFYILDQIGYVVWPDKSMIFPKNKLDINLKIDKIKYINQSNNLYIVRIKEKNDQTKEGIWNTETNTWELNPTNYLVTILNAENQIYTIQKENEGKFILYNNKIKKQIGTKSYDTINSDGLVRITTKNNEQQYYYIDIFTGKEYKE